VLKWSVITTLATNKQNMFFYILKIEVNILIQKGDKINETGTKCSPTFASIARPYLQPHYGNGVSAMFTFQLDNS
jgi:hypothetical protein